MEQPILKLTTKHFLTGIGPGAQLGVGGLFYKATGVTPLFETGTARSANNGLLMAGASATTVSGSINGNVLNAAQFTSSTTTTAYFTASNDHIYTLVLDSALSNSLTDAHTASNLRQGIGVFRSSNGGNVLFYFMNTAIGRCNLSGTYDDSWKTITSDDIHATHTAFDRLYFGNAENIGVLFDDGSGLATSSASNTNVSAFSIARYGRCTALSDDGLFLIIATTRNTANDPAIMPGCNILFWDTYSTLASNIQSIPDPFIFRIKKTSKGIFAVGTTGIWQISYGSQPQKVFSFSTGIYSNKVSGSLKYGHGAVSTYADALIWGGSSGSDYAVKTFGKLDASAPIAHLEPFKSTASHNITFVDGQLLKGWVFVCDDAPTLKAYPFSTTNSPQTSITAQTGYIDLPTKMTIKRLEVVFGEPLASDDQITMGIFTDEDTPMVSYGSGSYTSDGAIRRKTFIPATPAICDDQMSVYVSFDAGAVKIKSIEIFAEPWTT